MGETKAQKSKETAKGPSWSGSGVYELNHCLLMLPKVYLIFLQRLCFWDIKFMLSILTKLEKCKIWTQNVSPPNDTRQRAYWLVSKTALICMHSYLWRLFQ